MSYIDKHFINNETVISRKTLNWTEYFKSITFLILGFLFLFFNNGFGTFIIILALVSVVKSYLKINSSEFVLTDKRVIIKTGIFKTKSWEILLNKIEGIYIEQGIIEKIVNSGSIIIKGIGASASPFLNIDKPYEFRNAVNEQIQNYNN